MKKRLTLMIYGTHCELVNGKIREVGNDYVVPSAIQQKAVKRYEERMAQLLKGWKLVSNGIGKNYKE
ncbi:hypothetical protein [Agathobacter rectalis]|uniref:hypothetical protein n=1 Tax=Agathobacter rectalis TaxID=39491 RepID=UPI0027D2CD64|nr:hypothetical protein [Agathobacter rectalis]